MTNYILVAIVALLAGAALAWTFTRSKNESASIREGLEKMGTQLAALEKERAASHAALHEHLRLMGQGQQQLADETETLARALRAPQVRGQWGEMQLRRVVELAGMLEHCDFVEQLSVSTADGRLRPDLIRSPPRTQSGRRRFQSAAPGVSRRRGGNRRGQTQHYSSTSTPARSARISSNSQRRITRTSSRRLPTSW